MMWWAYGLISDLPRAAACMDSSIPISDKRIDGFLHNIEDEELCIVVHFLK